MQISCSLEFFMDRDFDDIIKYYSKVKQQRINNMFMDTGSKIKKYLVDNCEIDDFFKTKRGL
jgi:hypothetical protein